MEVCIALMVTSYKMQLACKVQITAVTVFTHFTY